MWVIFTEDGLPRWFGPEEPVTPAPPDTKELLPGMNEQVLLTSRRVGGEWVPRDPVIPPDPTPEVLAAAQRAALDQAKTDLLARVAEQTAAIRLRIFTELPGQDAIYTQKRAEATRFLAQPGQSLEGFPFLAAEVGITAPTALELAQLWLTRGQVFETVGAASEGARMRARLAVAAADSLEDLQAAENAFGAAMAALDQLVG